MFNNLAGYLGMPPELLGQILLSLLGLLGTGLGIAIWQLKRDMAKVEAAREHDKNEHFGEMTRLKAEQASQDRLYQILHRSEENRAKEASQHNEAFKMLAQAVGDGTKAQQSIAEQTQASIRQSEEFQQRLFDNRTNLKSDLQRIESTATHIEKTGDETLSKVDLISNGLEDIKKQLDNILTEAKRNPNKEALENIQKEIATLASLAKSQAEKPVNDDTVPPPPLADEPEPKPEASNPAA